jgi:hypothetical protein
MGFVAFGGEKRIAELVTRIYGRVKAADAKRAAAALLAANPELAHIDQVERGRPITVPPIPGLARRREADESAPFARGVAGLRDSMGGFLQRLDERNALEKRDLEETRSLLDSDDLRSIVDGDDAARELLERIAAATDVRKADTERRASFLEQVKKADEELAALVEALE